MPLATPDLPENVYHYSPFGGTVGVIESMVLWASDWRRLRDTTEFSYPREILARVVDRMRPTYTSEDALFILDDIATPLVNASTGLPLFVACLCSNGDLRSQWDNYAAGGTGFAVGLDRLALFEAAGQRFYSLGPVIYPEAEQEAHYQTVLSDAIGLVPEHRGTMSPLQLTLLFSLGLVITMTLVKNTAYSDELEWRLMRQQLAAGDSPNLKVRPPDIPYEEFPLEGLITEVVAGPRAAPESSDEVRRLLDKMGLERVPLLRSSLVW
jgi:hypothetical protein